MMTWFGILDVSLFHRRRTAVFCKTKGRDYLRLILKHEHNHAKFDYYYSNFFYHNAFD